MGDLVAALRRHRNVGFDTLVFVYHIDARPPRALPADLALQAVISGSISGVTSVLTLLELAIKPLRLGRPEAATAYETLVKSIDNLAVVGIDDRTTRTAAELRAQYWLRTPDALQIAACIRHGATAFLTNDRRLRRLREIEVLLLDDFVDPPVTTP